MYTKQVLAMAAVGLVLAGCAGSGAGIVGQNQPRVRLFNAVDGQATITATYKDATLTVLGTSTSASFGATSNDTIVTNTNVTATINSVTGALFTTPASLMRIGTFYSTYAGGVASNYKGLVLEDAQNASAAGTIGVRLVQVGVNSGAVDIYLVPTQPPTSPPALFTNIAYGAVSAAANSSQAVDANGYALAAITDGSTYNVNITAHGSATVIATTPVTASQGNYYTVVVFDTAGAAGTSVAVVTDRRTG